MEATVEQALKRPELRERFMAYLVRSIGPLLAANGEKKKAPERKGKARGRKEGAR